MICCSQGGEPDLMTSAKMVLNDWQRGKIPFFVPPPQQDGNSPQDTPISLYTDDEPSISADRKAAAMKAIAGIISSQQKMHVPAQKDFFGDDDGKAENENLDEPIVEPEGEDLEEPAAETGSEYVAGPVPDAD